MMALLMVMVEQVEAMVFRSLQMDLELMLPTGMNLMLMGLGLIFGMLLAKDQQNILVEDNQIELCYVKL
jgi:hypothetical protein